jgi:transcriptional regulator with XRE-family HTH domain
MMNQNDLVALGQVLRALRTARDLAQKEVIERSGVQMNERTLRAYESGNLRPSRGRLLNLVIRSLEVTDAAEINHYLRLAGYAILTDKEISHHGLGPLSKLLDAPTGSREPPVDFRIEVSTLIAVDGEGQEVWRHRFPNRLNQSSYQHQDALRRCSFADLDSDGRVETLFIYVPIDFGSVGTTLICFGQDGQIKWQFEPGKAVHDSTGRVYDPPYFISNVRIIRIPGSATQILVSSNHHLYNANQIAMLSPRGELISEYWHSGHLLSIAQADLNGDGLEEILLGGVNNGYGQATMVVFDPRNVCGASAQPGRQIVGFSAGTEKAVLLFPKTCAAKHAPYNRVVDVRVTREHRIIVCVAEGVSEGKNPGVMIYELDLKLDVISARPDSHLQESHRLLEVQGSLDHPWTDEESEQIRSQVVVERKS